MTPIHAATADGWVVPEAQRRLTPNRYSKAFQPGRIQPIEFVVYHYTAGGFDGSLRWLTSKDSSVSAHFIVRKDGAVWQLAPLNDRTWHAGGPTSKWRGRGQINNRSIGIEIENWGKLHHQNGVLFTYKNLEHKHASATLPNGETWDAYSSEQLEALERLTQELARTFPELRRSDGPMTELNGRLTGHQHVDPSRKLDPGPTFPWARMLSAAKVV